MAVNFTLSYNDGFQYVDLFPRTEINNIVNSGKILSYSKLEVNVPIASAYEQIIPIKLTEKQKKSIFYVKLIPIKTEDNRNYSTISGIKIVGDNLIINRLNNFPSNSIKIELIFLEGGV